MDWIRGKRLGHGSFAAVHLAVPRSQSSKLPPLMAVKSCGVSLSSSLMAEKLILEELNGCPEIIRCLGERLSLENGEKMYNILLEYAPGGSLADKLKNASGRRLPEPEVRRHTKSLLTGLRYIHDSGYVHCDLKLQNILLCQNGAVKIADFGLAKRAGARGDKKYMRGTPMYMSPEMVAGGDQGAAADVWALGCAVAEMVTGSPAWRCSDVAGLLMRIGGDESPEIPRDLSGEGRDFLARCFARDPNERWTAEMLLDHPFVGGGEEEEIEEECTAAAAAAASPRCAFDFPDDWISSVTCSITSLPPDEYSQEYGAAAAAEQLRELVCGQGPDWSVSDGWVTVR